ncbi:MAG TPA: class E sortase [Acidimicrobiales bacterium]|nr:class E sortase [Acidimicrobiales bacterium]
MRPMPKRQASVPALVVSVVAMLAVVTGCGGASPTAGAGPGRPVPDRPAGLWSPARFTRAARPAPTTTAPLSYPIAIPDDPYAPEPVVRLGTIEIPKIGLTHALFDGVTLHNIDQGPSHWPGSAMPGQLGNVVIAGHRVTHDHPFERIAELVAGDQVIFTLNGVRTIYRVTGHQVVKPSDTWIADQTRAFTATLYACHPPGSADQRFVVKMELAA